MKTPTPVGGGPHLSQRPDTGTTLLSPPLASGRTPVPEHSKERVTDTDTDTQTETQT